jgi:DNA-binding PadR family transcriptional regulator
MGRDNAAGEAIKGHLDGLLLSAVRNGPRHGYAICEQLRLRSGGVFDLPEGTVYPALHRLEDAGLLASRWEVEGGRRRRVYVLTPRGHAALGKERRAWKDFARAVTAILEGDPCKSAI